MLRHFMNEVEFLQKLKHPNIVSILDSKINSPLPIQSPGLNIAEYDCCSYIAMEFAERGNLFEYICFKPLSENATCYYLK